MTQTIYTSPRPLNTKYFMQLLQDMTIEIGNHTHLFSCENEYANRNKKRLRKNK
jgi:hypothetical protein